MKAIVWYGVGDIRLEDVKAPEIKDPMDVIVKLTASAICGTDLHLIRGTMPGMVKGTILGHEGVGVITELGKEVRNFNPGDRVIIPSTIGCGYCSYCRAGYYSQCDNANPKGKHAGTAFFGGPADAGNYHGMQAESVRVPFGNVNLVKIPGNVTDDQAIMLSDIFPTGYFGTDLAEIRAGDTVAIFGCGPVGLFAIISALLKDAGRVFAVDAVPSRLSVARRLGAEAIDYNQEDPVATIMELTGGIGVDRAIDAVGVDANMPTGGPASKESKQFSKKFQNERKQIAPDAKPKNGNWNPGSGPSQVLLWATAALAKAGTLGVIGVYPQTATTFPVGEAMMKNLTIKAGNCNHRKYIPTLLRYVQSGVVDPSKIVTQKETFRNAVDAYKAFDKRESQWIKVELTPARG